MDPNRLLDGLDADQRAAVTERTHPLAILAGAGSGKTRVLTHRIAHRCFIGDADSRHVLAVTFTRKAAGELDRRLRRMGLRDLPTTGTFHALAYAQLRSDLAPGAAAPVLLERKGRLLARILGATRRFTPADLANEIEWAKARLIAPDDYAAAATRADRPLTVAAEQVSDWYRRYEADKRRRKVVDFDDLLIAAADAMAADPSFASAIRWRHRHLFVDEYQDINPLQERLLRAWLGDRRDLCVVGDPNQAIYGWNGADPDLLRSFADHHPGAAVIRLGDSYRSSPQILGVASAVLRLGRVKVEPPRAHQPDGSLPVIVGYQSDVDEANGIARALRDQHRPGGSWSAQAVLVRTNAQAAVIEIALRRAGIPHRVRGRRRFLQDPDIRHLLDRMGRLREPLATTVEDLTASLTRQRSDLQAAHDDGASGTPELPDTAVARRLEGWEQLVRLAHELLAVEPGARADQFPGWLSAALRDDDPDDGDAVTLASFHSSKGLEWETVHLAGLEEGFVPISHARTSEAQAEEIRLLYVAVTRAARVLRCSWAARRSFGEHEVKRRPSPFLDAIRSTVETLSSLSEPVAAPASAIEASRRALGEPPADVAPTVRSAEAQVTMALTEWRRTRAREAGVQPTVILSDRALRDIGEQMPRTPTDLESIRGLGPLFRARFGATLLTVVADTLDRPD